MKKIYHSITYVTIWLLVGATLVSCAEFLEITPRDKVTEDNFWDEKADVEQMVAGCYTAMQNQDFIARCIVWGDLRGDDVDGASGITGVNDVYQALLSNLLPTNYYTNWASFYHVINKCNTIIRMAPIVSEKDPAYRSSDALSTIAEVTALRSLCYWYLIRAFEDVPFYRFAVQQEDEVEYPTPSSFNTVLTEIINDLEEVKGNALEHYPTSGNDGYCLTFNSNCNRITRNAIRAMLCDMYLWTGDYDKVIQNANEIMASKLKDYNDDTSITGLKRYTSTFGTAEVYLYPNSQTQLNNSFNQIFGSGNSYESLFELSFNYSGEGSPYIMNTALGRFYGAGITKEIDGLKVNNGVGLLRPMTNIVSEGSKSSPADWKTYRNPRDVRYYCNIRVVDNDYSEGAVRKGVALSSNVAFSGSGIVNYQSTNFILPTVMNRNWIFYRLTDVLLMAAEAYIMKSSDNNTASDIANLQNAFSLIDIVNQRSVVQDSYQLKNSPTTTRSTLIDMVRRERRCELMFEGKRWFDIIRYCRQDGKLDIARQVPAKCNSVASSNPFPSTAHLYWPYYKDEVKRNPNLKQKSIYDKESDSFELNN
ncbi:MAG: RagB/SusD family nutrient uptake outer membrane protein [Bacteroidaceae bacterium]|nr:RagB/SusD family nutrient uptake outer membrane protein [Bacteroidaceae bacterium]